MVGQTFSAASGLLGFLSGWYLRASFRYVFLMSSAVAVFGKPSVWYNVSPAVLERRTETVFSIYFVQGLRIIRGVEMGIHSCIH